MDAWYQPLLGELKVCGCDRLISTGDNALAKDNSIYLYTSPFLEGLEVCFRRAVLLMGGSPISSMDYPMGLDVFVRPLGFLVFGLDCSVLKICFRPGFLMIDRA